MPSCLPALLRARRPAGPSGLSGPLRLPARRPAAWAALGALVMAAALTGCSPGLSVENADVPQWRATALPTDPGTLLQDEGKILNRDRISQEAADVPAGRYTLSVTCEGGGKAFFAVSVDGVEIVDAGAACNGSLETTRFTVPSAGTLDISASSVDAPLIFAYQVTPTQ
jgi:hypothetical protein